MNNLILYPHGGSYNHGCEAIVRTTLNIMSQILPAINDNKVLFSIRPKEDLEFNLGNKCKILHDKYPLKAFSLLHIKGIIKKNIFNDKDIFNKYAYRKMINYAGKETLALSIGGDNYCYGSPKDIYYMNTLVRKEGSKTILWGCSIEPTAMDQEMIDDLKLYNLIFARETITYNSLLEKGLSNVRLCPDPAFLLETEKVDLPHGFDEENTVGINLSPMIMSYEKNDGAAFQNYSKLVDYLIENTNCQIALIPHVMWSFNDDRIPLEKLYSKFKDSNRVIFIANNNEFNAMQLKYIISKCKMFIAARTHSSIASYSQCVPTLVVGYSVKAKGIAKDLFGSEEGYVIPVQSLENDDDLINIYIEFSKKEKDIRQNLINNIPEYKSRIMNSAKEISTLMN